MNHLADSLLHSDFLRSLLWWLALLSFFTFALSIILIPIIVGRLPQDCFITSQWNDPKLSSSCCFILLIIFRNFLGILLVLAGIVMLFIPGQGLLTILLGSLLISFPGKKRLIHWMINQPKIQSSLDWLRKKRGKVPFNWPETQADADLK